jgi:hypothetical protein
MEAAVHHHGRIAVPGRADRSTRKLSGIPHTLSHLIDVHSHKWPTQK